MLLIKIIKQTIKKYMTSKQKELTKSQIKERVKASGTIL